MHLQMRSNDQLLNSSKGSVLKKGVLRLPSGGSYTYYRFMHHAEGDRSLAEKLGNRHINYYVLHNL